MGQTRNPRYLLDRYVDISGYDILNETNYQYEAPPIPLEFIIDNIKHLNDKFLKLVRISVLTNNNVIAGMVSSGVVEQYINAHPVSQQTLQELKDKNLVSKNYKQPNKVSRL